MIGVHFKLGASLSLRAQREVSLWAGRDFSRQKPPLGMTVFPETEMHPLDCRGNTGRGGGVEAVVHGAVYEEGLTI